MNKNDLKDFGLFDLRFTVITVCLNAEKVIEKTILSVLNQSVSPYEYLIIDGASKDRTVDIARTYSDSFAQKGIKYKILSEEDTGTYNAMNKGIKRASGDFISFLNAGDWYELDALQKIKSFYNDQPFQLTYGGLHYVTPNGKVINKMSRKDRFLISTRNWNHPSMFLRREIYQEYGFDESYPVSADFNLYLKLRQNGTKIRIIDEIITNFVANGVSTNPNLKHALKRASEKYRIYRANGYGMVYWLECYGWELAKVSIIWLHRKRV